MEFVRFSARGVSTVTVDRLKHASALNRMYVGALLDEAVEIWWETLEEVPERREAA